MKTNRNKIPDGKFSFSTSENLLISYTVPEDVTSYEYTFTLTDKDGVIQHTSTEADEITISYDNPNSIITINIPQADVAELAGTYTMEMVETRTVPNVIWWGYTTIYQAGAVSE